MNSQKHSTHPMTHINGALLLDKPAGISSFGVIEALQHQLIKYFGLKRRDFPKLGHGGTLDPFATGLLIVCVGNSVKLARYFLGANKIYEGTIRFGETTIPGDPTAPVSETSTVIPESIDSINELAHRLTLQPYLQIPPMHSAKKKNGKPLYELARAGIEIEREPKLCHLYQFRIFSYDKPRAQFELTCGSGTYVRTLAQDMGRLLGTVALLENLKRTGIRAFELSNAWTLGKLQEASSAGKMWNELPCWLPFDRLLEGYDRAEATDDEAGSLAKGRQSVLFNILKRTPAPQCSNQDSCIAIYNKKKLIAVARRDQGTWGIERVFTSG
jgi:tRNA pseudouridine55 synthase